MSSRTKRQELQAQRRRKRVLQQAIFGAIGLILLGLVGYFLWVAFRPSAGESVAVMPDSNHVDPSIKPGPYNSDPPTSGPHFAEEFDAGFYDEQDVSTLPQFHEGYLVHNLEHGYVIFWYNCDASGVDDCEGLKSQIQAVMDRFSGVKLIAFPWPTIEEPVVMTSWGKMMRVENFDQDIAADFVERNRNRAPESNAP